MASNPVGFGQMFESAEGSSESHDDCIYIFVLDFFLYFGTLFESAQGAQGLYIFAVIYAGHFRTFHF